jgi:hypothetical protein
MAVDACSGCNFAALVGRNSRTVTWQSPTNMPVTGPEPAGTAAGARADYSGGAAAGTPGLSESLSGTRAAAAYWALTGSGPGRWRGPAAAADRPGPGPGHGPGPGPQ